MNKSYAKIISIAGGFIISALGFGFYHIYNKRSSDKLSIWLEEYIAELEKSMRLNGKGSLKLDNIAGLMNLITEVEDYLYTKDEKNLEQKRMSYLNNSLLYEETINQELELHEQTFTKAIEIVEKRLKVNCVDLKENIINHSSNKEYMIALEKNQKDFENLPQIDKDVFRKAYLLYAENAIKKDKLSKNLLTFPSIKHEYKDIVLDIYILNKYLLKDSFQKECGINEKYIYQLLKKHSLLTDPEIIAKREVLFNL